MTEAQSTLMQRNGPINHVFREYQHYIDTCNCAYVETKADGTKRTVGLGVYAHLNQKEQPKS